MGSTLTKEETAYIQGSRSAWRAILSEAIKNLGYESPEAKASSWISEREAAIAQLRQACGDHGDNDWTENLHLADIIEKHLVRHLPTTSK